MGESLVAFGHPVCFFLPLDSPARVLGGVKDLEGKLLGHALAAALAGETHDPPPRQGKPALRPDLDGDLIRSATDPPRLDLEQRGGIAKGQVEDLQRLFLGLLAGAAQRLIYNLLGG